MPDLSTATQDAEEPGRSSRFGATLRALGHRNYRLFFSGQLISVIGTLMQQVGQS